MERKFLYILDTLLRVQAFLVRQSTVLGTLISAGLKARLDDAITQLTASQVEQAAARSAAQGETANQALYRQTFYAGFMRPIARIAKASLKNTPEYPAFVVPSTGVRNGDFVGAAQALADAAAKHEQQIITGGMPADFLAQLRAAIAQLTASKASGDENSSRRQAATKGIADASKIGKDVLVILDSLITTNLKQNVTVLADWEASARILGTVTTLPPQPLGLPSAAKTSAADEAPTTATEPVVPIAPTDATTVAPAPQATKPAA